MKKSHLCALLIFVLIAISFLLAVLYIKVFLGEVGARILFSILLAVAISGIFIMYFLLRWQDILKPEGLSRYPRFSEAIVLCREIEHRFCIIDALLEQSENVFCRGLIDRTVYSIQEIRRQAFLGINTWPLDLPSVDEYKEGINEDIRNLVKIETVISHLEEAINKSEECITPRIRVSFLKRTKQCRERLEKIKLAATKYVNMAI